MTVKIERDKYYSHPNLLDNVIYIVRVILPHPEYYKLEVIWINRANPSVWNVDRIDIQRKDLPKWTEVQKPRKNLHP